MNLTPAMMKGIFFIVVPKPWNDVLAAEAEGSYSIHRTGEELKYCFSYFQEEVWKRRRKTIASKTKILEAGNLSSCTSLTKEGVLIEELNLESFGLIREERIRYFLTYVLTEEQESILFD